MKGLALLALVPFAAIVGLSGPPGPPGPSGFGQDSWEEDVDEQAILLDEPQDPVPSPARLAAAAELRTPGEEHRLLARMAGSWSAETLAWHSPNASDPQRTRGRLEAEMVLGGRFLRIEARGGAGELESEQLALLGFDRRWGEYTCLELDTSGTHSIHARGHFDPETRTLSLLGEDRDPVLEVTHRLDFVYEFVDDDTIVRSVVARDRWRGNKGPYTLTETTLRRR